MADVFNTRIAAYMLYIDYIDTYTIYTIYYIGLTIHGNIQLYMGS